MDPLFRAATERQTVQRPPSHELEGAATFAGLTPPASPLERIGEVLSTRRESFGEICECVGNDRRQVFVDRRNELPSHLKPFLDQCSLDEYDCQGVRLFLTGDGNGGYGLRNGELVSVFCLPRQRQGISIVRHAIEQGAWWLTCLDARGALSRFYEGAGFVVAHRQEFCDQFSPAGWDFARYGRPDFLRMELPGEARKKGTAI